MDDGFGLELREDLVYELRIDFTEHAMVLPRSGASGSATQAVKASRTIYVDRERFLSRVSPPQGA